MIMTLVHRYTSYRFKILIIIIVLTLYMPLLYNMKINNEEANSLELFIPWSH